MPVDGLVNNSTATGATATGTAAAGWNRLRGRFVVDLAPGATRLPELGCTVDISPPALDAVARDQGSLVSRRPAAVARPTSGRDVQRLISFCSHHDIPVAARGSGHSTHGQAQVAGGLVLDMTGLNRIHEITDDSVDVDAGALWRDVAAAVADAGRRLAAGVPGHLGLSVGGVLAVGGITPAYTEGAIIDRVSAVEVVTGTGQHVWCSREHHPELFAVVLAGLGQCAIILRARIALAPAPKTVRTYALDYTAIPAFLTDLRCLVQRREVDELYCRILPPTAESGPVLQLRVAAYIVGADSDDDAHLLRGLNPQRVGPIVERAHREHVFDGEAGFAALEAAGWDHYVKPWLNLFVGDSHIEAFLTDLLPRLTPQDWSETGFVLLHVRHRAAFTRPLLPIPTDGLFFLVDVLGDSGPHPDPAYGPTAVARNVALLAQARRQGAVGYRIGSTPYTRQDWAEHFGPQWPGLVEAKHHHDPAAILTPGQHIFSTGT